MGMMFAERTEFVAKIAQFVLEFLVIVHSKADGSLYLDKFFLCYSCSCLAFLFSEFAKARRRPQGG